MLNRIHNAFASGKGCVELIRSLQSSGDLWKILPEAKAAVNFPQPKRYHTKDVWEHTLGVLGSDALSTEEERLAALFHDLGKPEVWDGAHFLGHAKVSARIAEDVLNRWGYP